MSLNKVAVNLVFLLYNTFDIHTLKQADTCHLLYLYCLKFMDFLQFKASKLIYCIGSQR